MAALLESREERAAFADWLTAHTDIAARGADAIEVTAPASGWSNDTGVLSVDGERLVLKLAPAGLAMFPTYDLSKEWDVLRVLHARGTPPVPRPIGYEATGTVLGRPFLAMAFVAGDIPSDNEQSYAAAGWLVDAPPVRQAGFWRELVAAIAAVHEVDWQDGALARLAPSTNGALVDPVDWLDALHRWSAAPQPDIEAGLARLREAMPDDPGTGCLLWGDARPANVVARDLKVTALLDWELAHVGPPEMDVAWLQEMHWLRTAGAGVTQPAGFPGDDAIAALYEQASSRRLRPLAWYRLLAAAKVAILMYRHLAVAVDRGKLPPGHPVLTDNVATRRLRALLGT